MVIFRVKLDLSQFGPLLVRIRLLVVMLGLGLSALGAGSLALPTIATAGVLQAGESSSCHSPCCAEKLQLTDKLLQAVLAEARVVCTGQPVLIAGDLNADLSVIPCLAKAVSEGRFVDLALAYILLERRRGLRLPASSSWTSVLELVGVFILGCSDAAAASTACMVTDRWFPLIFLCWLPLVLMVGLPRFPAPSFPSLCGPHPGLTLLIGLLHLFLVLFRMLGMRIKMNLVLYLLRLYLLCGTRCQGLRLMIFGPLGARLRRLVSSGRIVGRVVPLQLAALPFWEEACYGFVVGVLEAELLVAVDLVGCFGLVRGMKLMSIVLITLLTLLSLPLYSFVGASSLWRMCLRRYGPCGPISSLDPWDWWIPPDLHGFYRCIF